MVSVRVIFGGHLFVFYFSFFYILGALLSLFCFSLLDFRGVLNKAAILLALVGYEMIIANTALRVSLAIYHLISNARSWNNGY